MPHSGDDTPVARSGPREGRAGPGDEGPLFGHRFPKAGILCPTCQPQRPLGDSLGLGLSAPSAFILQATGMPSAAQRGCLQSHVTPRYPQSTPAWPWVHASFVLYGPQLSPLCPVRPGPAASGPGRDGTLPHGPRGLDTRLQAAEGHWVLAGSPLRTAMLLGKGPWRGAPWHWNPGCPRDPARPCWGA